MDNIFHRVINKLRVEHGNEYVLRVIKVETYLNSQNFFTIEELSNFSNVSAIELTLKLGEITEELAIYEEQEYFEHNEKVYFTRRVANILLSIFKKGLGIEYSELYTEILENEINSGRLNAIDLSEDEYTQKKLMNSLIF